MSQRAARVTWILGAGLIATAGAAGCGPTGSGGGCQRDEDCTYRGDVCDVSQSQCVPGQWDLDSTAEDPPPSSFSDQPIPFFRGRVCYPVDGRTPRGQAMPLAISPCVHPCMTTAGASFQHQWSCVNASCEGLTVYSYRASATACPAEAFGRFDPAECTYPITTTTSLGPINGSNGQPLDANLSHELPFLTNADMAAIAGFDPADASPACASQCSASADVDRCRTNCFAKSLATRYPREAGRVLTLRFAADAGQVPSECGPSVAGCTCVDVGF